MQRKKFLIYFILFLTFPFVHPLILTDLCPTYSCNCTLTDYTNLDITCDLTANSTELPLLINTTLQTSVTQLRISSSIIGTHGPLIRLPTNICSSYPNIAILDLSLNAITGFVNTSELACLGSNLLRIDLSNNYITDIETNFFISNSKIQSIDVSQNNLITMPMIDGETFVNFPSTITLMNFSYNQITNVDLWPLFVKTRNFMTIDLSYNSIKNFTNYVPIFVKQFTETPDPRDLLLNHNQIERISDLLLEQYGACSILSPISTAYFVVGISNMLLTDNSLICDCESSFLITYIIDHIYDFPQIYNGSALITQATCASPASTAGQKYIFANFTGTNACDGYVLPNITDIFCLIYSNDTSATLPPPTYWPTSSTLTTIINGNGTTTTSDEGDGNGGSGNGGNNGDGSSDSGSPSWYIILGIVLGVVLLLSLIILGIFLCRDRILPERCRSKFGNNTNSNNSYEPMIRNSELLSRTAFPLNGIKRHRTSMLTDGDGNGIHSDNSLSNSWSDRIHPEQETQTCFQITRPKPSTNPSRPTRNRQRIPNNNNNNNNHENSLPALKPTISAPADVATNTTGVIKGIPISTITPKIPSIFSNINDTLPDTSTSEVSVTSIPLTPSKRAKALPPIKSGVYMDSTNKNLLNTSASALITNHRQRRQSSMWTHKQQQNTITPSSIRPQSMSTRKTSFSHDDSFNDDISSIPTVESSNNKPSKPLRALPLLNITVVPAWIDDKIDQK